MDTEKRRRDKERENARFAREELGELLKLFSALGITVALGILGFFLLGLWVDRKLAAMGWHTYGAPRIVFTLLGLCLVIYWAYLRIARHLDKYEKPEDRDDSTSGGGSP